MTRFGLDSTQMVPVAAHHAVGSSVAIRYLSRSSWKVVTRAEYDAYRKNGIDLCLVFEDSGRPDLMGYEHGKADAQFALSQAHAILPKPKAPPRITFAWDTDPSPIISAADDYYNGVAAVMGHQNSGPYGGFPAIQRMAFRGFHTLYQTYAWSGGRFYEGSTLFQYSNDHTIGGVGTDFDKCLGEDFGQWDRPLPGPPVPADPHHYLRYEDNKYGRGHTERETAILYDEVRGKLTKHKLQAELERDCGFFAKRIAFEARSTKVGPTWGVPTWGIFHRGWRYQQLAHRSQGKKVV